MLAERPITPALQSPQYLEYLERKALLQKAADERSAARRARYPEQRTARAAAFDPDIDYDKVEYPDYDDLTDEEYRAARVAKMNAMIATARNYEESPKLSQQLRRYTPALHIREENQRIREVQAAKLAIDLLGPRSANASGLRGRMGRAFDTTYDITRHNVDEAVAAALAKANIEFDQEDPVLLATLGSGPRAPGYTRHLQALPPPPAPPPPSILGTAHAQHSGTMYDEKAPFVFDMNPSSDEESSDDGDIPFGPMSRRRIVA